MLTERSISCRGVWGHPYPTKEEKRRLGNLPEKVCEKYGPKLNPGSVIFVDGNLFGVVEMVGHFERELYGTLGNW